MNMGKRKRVLALAISLGTVGIVAALAVFTGQGGIVWAQGGCDGPVAAPFPKCQNEDTTPSPPAGDGMTMPAAPDTIRSSSTSANATVELRLTIDSLPEDMYVGSSVELYLENDFQVPDAIGANSVYFTANPVTRQTGSGARVHATNAAVIRNGPHLGGNNDWSIRVLIPDLCASLTDECEGPNGPMQYQTLTMVINDDAGIKNPSEAGSYGVGYSLLGPADNGNRGPEVLLEDLPTYAKISLSDEDNTRGYHLIVTGAGFNDGTSAAVYVLHDGVAKWWDTLNCAEMNAVVGSNDTEGRGYCRLWAPLSDAEKDAVLSAALSGSNASTLCQHIIGTGWRAGIALVNADSTVSVTLEVTVPEFRAGDQNYLCMIDGEGRRSDTDVEQFTLEPSVSASPTNAITGTTITLSVLDLPNAGATFSELKIAGFQVFPAQDGNDVAVTAGTVGQDGSAVASFRLPESIALPGSANLPGGAHRIPLEGSVSIEGKWGNVWVSTKMTVVDPDQSPAPEPGYPPPATNIAVRDGANPGEVVIAWDAVPEATHYRVGYVNMVTDYPLAKASQTGNWLEAFVYVDVEAQNFTVVGGRTEYTIRRLEQGVRHAFTVRTGDSPHGDYTWPSNPRWQFHPVAGRGGGCPSVSPMPDTASDAARAALAALYAATGGTNWENNTNWLSEKPVGDWYGVAQMTPGA